MSTGDPAAASWCCKLEYKCFPVRLLVPQEDKVKAGVIRLSSFNARAQRDVKAAILELQARGAQRFVLDLRDNRGGLVSEGLEVRTCPAALP